MKKRMVFWCVPVSCRSWLGNPFYLVALVMLSTFSLYLLRWSDLFPPLQGHFLGFIILTVLLFIAFGRFLGGRLEEIGEGTARSPSLRVLALWTVVLLGLYAAEIVYNGKMPLMDLLGPSKGRDFRTFTAFPFLHYMALAAGLLLIALLFQRCLDERGWLARVLIGLNFLPFLLFFNRAAFILAGTQILLYTILRVKALHRVTLVAGLLLAVLGAYLFGVAGDFRERAHSVPFDELSRINGSYPAFLPRAFSWGYMYAASPMANLQRNIAAAAPRNPDFLSLAAFELLPAKARMAGFWRRFGLEAQEPSRIASSFNVSTVFAGPYVYAGWWGIGAMVLAILAILTGFTLVLGSPSPYSLVTLSILCTFSIFNFFANMLSFTPMFLLLFGSMGLHLLHRAVAKKA